MSSPQCRVAVVDDDPAILSLVRTALEPENVKVDSFTAAQEFRDRALAETYDLILCDLVLPGMTGIDLLREVREKTHKPQFVVMTGQGTIGSAVQAMKDGATDFLVKPFKIQDLLVLVAAARKGLPDPFEPSSRRDFAVGGSAAWRRVLERAFRVAGLPTTVLIRGETGTGKEVLARYIASFGPRSGKLLVALNCAAMPEHLIESELFGHVRGAFSGADAVRRGLFEEANGGTLFLDEIGAIPHAAQAKMLRALEEGQIRRVGDNKTIDVDVRILAATNLDLEAAMARNDFRADLYFRLSVVTLTIPPLRDRTEDIAVLAEHFIETLSPPGRPAKSLSPEALGFLEGYPFPGNVRELKHAVEHALIFSASPRLEPNDFGLLAARENAREAPPPADPGGVTPDRLQEALKKTGGNRVEAARLLKISRSTLYRLLRQVDAQPPS